MKLQLHRLITTKRLTHEHCTHTKNFISNKKITKTQLKHHFPTATKINTQKHKGNKLITITLKNDPRKSHLTWREVASKNKNTQALQKRTR
ncbi:hypothetical protein ACWNX2_00705 [Candidatus Vidania fulgoroideorum]